MLLLVVVGQPRYFKENVNAVELRTKNVLVRAEEV